MTPEDDEFRVETRLAGPGDTAYLTRTWLRGFCERPELRETHRPVVTALLERCTALVAHPAGDPETILGFIVSDAAAVHWLYVRLGWRGFGIARVLAAAAGVGEAATFTHWTDDARSLCKRFKSLVYYPYLVAR